MECYYSGEKNCQSYSPKLPLGALFFIFYFFFKANVGQTLRCLAEISFLRCCTFAFMQLNPVVLIHFHRKLMYSWQEKSWSQNSNYIDNYPVNSTKSKMRYNRMKYNSVPGIKTFCWILIDLLLVAACVQDHLGRLRIPVRFDIKTSPLRKRTRINFVTRNCP